MEEGEPKAACLGAGEWTAKPDKCTTTLSGLFKNKEALYFFVGEL